MTLQIATLLGLLLAAMVLFSVEWISADVVAIGVLLALILTGLLDPEQAFAGFGSGTVIFLLGLLIQTAALVRTGVVDIIGRWILRHTGSNPDRLLLMIMVVSGGIGAFMSNTASVALFIPIVFGLAQRARISPSKLLMPLAFSSLLTSSVTLISTSSNIIVSGLLVQSGLEPMGMFELAPVGIPIAIVGIAYMTWIGKRLIPDRARPEDLVSEFGLGPYLTEIIVLPESPLIGKTVAESGLGRDLDLQIVKVVRAKTRHLAPDGSTRLEGGDELWVEGSRDEILKVKDAKGIDIKADAELGHPETPAEDLKLAEAILLPRSPLIGRTLKGLRFRERYGLQVLALNRHGETIRRKLSQIRLQMGDTVLVQGPPEPMAALHEDGTIRVLGTVEDNRPKTRRARRAIFIFVSAVLLAAFEIVPLPVAMLLGALAILVTRCITPEEAYLRVEWKAIILIGSMLAIGAAMDKTGTAHWIAESLVALVGDAGPLALLSGFFIATILLTQPMSNQAAAVVIVPIALQTAQHLSYNPRTFAMMIAVAASCSYLTPLEPACLMVYGPGRYKFRDFLKVGSLLTVAIYVIAIIVVPLVWPV